MRGSQRGKYLTRIKLISICEFDNNLKPLDSCLDLTGPHTHCRAQRKISFGA